MQEELNKDEFLATVGKHIAQKRSEIGISGSELAGRCGMDRQVISRIEQGETNPTIYTLKRISRGLGISLEELFAGMQ